MASKHNKTLGTIWLLVAGLFLLATGLSIKSMFAPEGSVEYEHSEWSPAAAIFALAAALPFLISGIGLIRGWRGERWWQAMPTIILVAVLYLFWDVMWAR